MMMRQGEDLSYRQTEIREWMLQLVQIYFSPVYKNYYGMLNVAVVPPADHLMWHGW